MIYYGIPTEAGLLADVTLTILIDCLYRTNLIDSLRMLSVYKIVAKGLGLLSNTTRLRTGCKKTRLFDIQPLLHLEHYVGALQISIHT